jgi:hypothetical protein
MILEPSNSTHNKLMNNITHLSPGRRSQLDDDLRQDLSGDDVSPTSTGYRGVPSARAVQIPGEPNAATDSTTSHSRRRLLLFIVTALSFAYVPTFGRIYLSELLLGIYVFHCLVQRRHLAPVARTIILLGVIWLLCQAGSDLYNETPLDQTVRSLANISALLLDLTALYFLFERERELRGVGLLVATGLLLAGLGTVLVEPDTYTRFDPWKFGMAFPVTFFVGALSLWLRRAAAIPMLILSGVNFALNFRSLGAICLLSAAFIVLTRGSAPRTRTSANRWHPLKALPVVVAIGAAILGGSYIYDLAARHDWLGEEAADKYAYQAHGRYGVLGGGRVEIYFSSVAVQRRPLIGYGSQPRMTPDLAILALNRLSADGYRLYPGVLSQIARSKTIPTHSFIMGAWVEAGIGGLLFWVSMTGLLASLLLRLLKQGRMSNGLLTVAFAITVWNVFFSPLGAAARLDFSIMFSMLLWTAESSRNPEKRL